MGFVVKNTIKINWLDLLCPYTCMGCGRLGELVCQCCKNDIKRTCRLSEQELTTLVKTRLSPQRTESKLVKMWAVGERKGLLDELVKAYKYTPTRGAGQILADLLAEAIPDFMVTEEAHMSPCVSEENHSQKNAQCSVPNRVMTRVVVVPLPTVRQHIRERGFDHAWLLAKKLACRRGWHCKKILKRTNSTVQVGASAEQRWTQARGAYQVGCKLDKDVAYLLIDDVWTTGASMQSATEALWRAGACKIYGAVVAVGK